MRPTSALLHPTGALGGAVFAAVVRDTRGTDLDACDRLNHFPASPLVSVTYVAAGALYLLDQNGARKTDALPQLSVVEPQSTPTTSWSPGPVLAISLAIYPEAWAQFCAKSTPEEVIERLRPAFAQLAVAPDIAEAWPAFCAALERQWTAGQAETPRGIPMLSGWVRGVMARAALSGSGRSLRSIERRVKRWTGQTGQALAFFARVEELHRLRLAEPDAPLAALAHEAGYADQAHMGRAVRRATGFSPADLNRRIETEEAFWCYRLLGQRF